MSTIEFEKHILQHQQALYATAFSLTSARDDAKDLVQDTILRALSKLHRFVDHTNFKGWIHTIMRNLYISNYHRPKKHGYTVDFNDELMHEASHPALSDEVPHGAVISHDIDVALATFNPEFRIPFSLYLKGYKYSEIARMIGVPLGTIKSRIFYVRKRMQQLLKEYRPA